MMGKRGNIFPLAGRYVLLALFFVFTVFPFLWLLLTSLKGSRELYEFPVR